MKTTATIYGVKKNDTYHYIGKTIKEKQFDGNIKNTDVAVQYANPELRQVFINQQVVVETLKDVPLEDWYDEKLEEVLKKYREKNPLLNAQWMLDGKRGYWQDKKRDDNTLKRLSESKYKKICQYNSLGILIHTWNSIKDVATQIFGDYRVENGSGCSNFYTILRSQRISGRFKHNSYWFKYEDLYESFGSIPKYLDINLLKSIDAENHKINKKPRELILKYTVRRFDKNGKIIAEYLNVEHCAYELRLTIDTVRRLSNGFRKSKEYLLKYGERTLQPVNANYPSYEPKAITTVKNRADENKFKNLNFRGLIEYDDLTI